MENNFCKNCTGCGACANVCPVGAIEMRANSEGFLYPHIDQTKCVNCGLCAKTCPVNNYKHSDSEKPLCYAAMAKDSIRAKSSSGGIFGVLAQYILKQNGLVCGAAWNTENRCVEHIIIQSLDDLSKLQSSKYIQSDTKKVYKEIKTALNSGKTVLFTGTPCQNAGVRAVCGDNDNLYCVDIVCHGTPSPKVFRKYLDELNLEGDFIKTDFRDKVDGWKPAHTITTTTTTDKHSCHADKDDFMLAFLKNFCLRKSCGRCPFNRLPRQGDLTIGDFWGVKSKYDDKRGTSVVLANNPHGQELLSKIKHKLKLLKKVDLSAALPGNPCIVESTSENPLREKFFDNLDKKSLRKNIEELNNFQYDYLCLNFYTSLNYGAVLTAYASQELLANLGYTSAHIDYRYPHITDDKYNNSFTDKFVQKYLNHTQRCRNIWNFNEIAKMAKRGFIVGSDQVFRDDYIRKTYFYYLLGFAPTDKQRIALSASFGKDSFDLPETSGLFDCFDAISVREDDGLKFIPNAVHLLDPVFLADTDIFHKLADSVQTPKCKVVGYVLDKTDEHFDKNIAYENISVEEYLSYIKNADLVVTDSFHGTCFAILFNRPFVTLGNTHRGNSRFESLFRDLEITDTKNPDWDAINKRIEKRRNQGIKWLKTVLSDNNIKNIELRNKLKSRGFVNTKKKKKVSLIKKIFSVNRQGSGHMLYMFGIKIKF